VAARTVPDADRRGEVVEVALRSSAGDGVAGRARELAGVVRCGLLLRSAAATGGSAGRTWRQGAGLGGLLVLVAAFAEQVARPPGVAAVGLGVAVAAVGSGRRVVAVAVGLPVLALVVGTGPPGAWPVVSALVVALVGLASPDGSWPWPVAGGGRSTAVVAGAGLLLAVGGPGAATGVVVVVTLVGPLVLLAGGTGDARLAAAAATAWGWRFLVLDPGDVVDAVVALRDGGLDLVLVRLVLMAWGVVVAVAVADRSRRSALAL
jgi:hypothetical protein